MKSIQRKSPIGFDREPVQKENWDGWEVAISYGTGNGPFLIDLSHRSKWDLQDADLSRFQPFGLTIPGNPGQCVYRKGIIINRMNRTQCAIWHLAGKQPKPPREPAYTETTDGHTLLAVTGKDTLGVMERITNLDLGAPALTPPCLIQGPILHIPCQVVLFSRGGGEATILFSFSRGYGQTMAEALLDSGKDLGLVPGGELDLTIVP
ncbi:MAG: hypothetical protein B1H13_07645 [Desulfobacteraceae bacterium 4484_190.3]|nr:MAG: hypothetical protein B1H13_07645 [Desulfobacteraceae bacterium 4484_190.3]